MVRQSIRLCVVFSIFVLGVAGVRADEAATPSRWPMHVMAGDGADVTIFQPQLEDFQGDIINAQAAVAVVPAGQETPIFGAIWLKSRVETDRLSRTVVILDVQVTRTTFPSSQNISPDLLSRAVRQVILAQRITLPLDHLLASLEAIHKEESEAADLQSAPPAIIFRDHPAVKVQYDGTPRLEALANGGGIMRAVNTPFFVALDPVSHKFFLKGAGHWFVSSEVMGPFTFSAQAPSAISQVAVQSGYVDPQQAIPDDEASRLEIVTATEPTELIWTDGQPQLSTIPGTNLLYWANTDSNVFLDITTQQMYVLLSGRWYTAGSTNGPWSYVPPDHIPSDFANIPPDSPKASVLASVPGTQQAQDAIADTEIPQTAAVDANNYDQPDVDYDGQPDFDTVVGTNCSYARNCECPVLDCGGEFYCCYNAVWYQCDHPSGHWLLCHKVPRDIYTIPPSCPIYPVRFCYVYGFSGTVVYVGYTPGYVGCYAANGVVVYGTGYRYHPWFQRRFIPRPATFGFAAQYHPYTGHWGFAFGLASGGGQTWINSAPKTPYQNTWFGLGGYRATRPTGALKIKRTIVDAGNIKRQTYDRNVYDGRHDLHPEFRAAAPPAENREATHLAAKTPDRAGLNENNVFVNDRGDIYRRTDAGWQRLEGNQWKAQSDSHTEPQRDHNAGAPEPVEPDRTSVPPERVENSPPHETERLESPGPSAPPERDYQAREEGDQRSSQADNPPPREEAPSEAPHSESGRR